MYLLINEESIDINKKTITEKVVPKKPFTN